MPNIVKVTGSVDGVDSSIVTDRSYMEDLFYWWKMLSGDTQEDAPSWFVDLMEYGGDDYPDLEDILLSNR
jgi:hypothetical protein